MPAMPCWSLSHYATLFSCLSLNYLQIRQNGCIYFRYEQAEFVESELQHMTEQVKSIIQSLNASQVLQGTYFLFIILFLNFAKFISNYLYLYFSFYRGVTPSQLIPCLHLMRLFEFLIISFVLSCGLMKR